jgi:hypothetical protein
VRWLGENSAGTNRRLQVDVDKVIYRPGQPIRIIARAFDEQARAVDSYRIRARLQLADPPAEPNANVPGNSSRETAKAVELTSVDLAPSLNDHVYRGELTAPTAGTVLEDPGSTLQQLILEIEAFDGDRQVANTRLGLRLLDDPAEFVDPRPDADRLIQLANATGGQVLRSPQGLVELLTTQGRAGDRIVTYQTPLWDNVRIWALLLGLLAAEWIVRRSRGLA